MSEKRVGFRDPFDLPIKITRSGGGVGLSGT